jgi:NMD protein affecting ribosome stability and mRNA decay
MSVALRCNRCGKVSENDKDFEAFLEVRFAKKGTGRYYTVHLCESCEKLFGKFMQKETVRPSK